MIIHTNLKVSLGNSLEANFLFCPVGFLAGFLGGLPLALKLSCSS